MAMKPQVGARFNDSTLVVGIDIAKHHHVAVAEGPGGSLSKAFTFANTRAGFLALEGWILKMSRHFGTSTVVVGLEPTGHYWKALSEWLLKQDHAVRLVSPVTTRRAKDMLDGSPLKTDVKDARVIADLVRQGKSRSFELPSEAFQELRYLADIRKRLVTERGSQKNRLHRLLDLLFPELLGHFSRLDTKAGLALLRVAPTPQAVLALGVEPLETLLAAASRKRVGADKARAIFESARTSVGCARGAAALQIEIMMILSRLDELAVQCAQVEQAMKRSLEAVPYASLLLTIPGMGLVTVAVVIGELGDLRNYRHARQVLKMAGLGLFERSSGQQQGHRHITKRGRPELRHMLHMAAMRMSAKGRPLHGLRQKMSPYKPGPVLLVAGTRRLLRTMFAMVRDGRPFEQTIFEVRPASVPGVKQAA